MSAEKPLDVICLGRAAVDIYAQQVGAPLEDVSSFAKYLGGCAGNIAVGTARLGLRSAMLTRVGDEHMGRFVRQTLAAEGVDVSHVKTDPARLTGLVLLGLRDQHTFPLIFYRENCADMALDVKDFDEGFIGSAKALLVTGTHFSTEQSDRTSRAAIQMARKAGTKVVLDVDYRPVLWGLTGRGEGEQRFMANDRVSAHLQSIVKDCDLIVGTEEEIHIAGGTTDTMAALRALRSISKASVVMKRGPLGCAVFDGPIPASVEQARMFHGNPVEVLNVLGAGDAFLSGLLRGWIRGEGWEKACAYANACGALVVSRHGCAPAMPTSVELDDYMARAARIPRIDLDERLSHLHRVTTRRGKWPQVCALAFDHRLQLEQMAQEAGAPSQRLPPLKRLLARAAREGAKIAGIPHPGVIIDDKHGLQALHKMNETGFWMARPMELPGSRPLRFEAGGDPHLILLSWPRHHVAKVLTFYHPDDEAGLRLKQQQKLVALQQACAATDRELLIEVIPPKDSLKDDATLSRALEQMYQAGLKPDWWKLPPPTTAAAWKNLETVIHAGDEHCRGILLLGLDAPESELAEGFRVAKASALCKGFAVGRTIFGKPSQAWLSGKLSDDELVKTVADGFVRVFGLWMSQHGGVT